jgi:hypothetical protein
LTNFWGKKEVNCDKGGGGRVAESDGVVGAVLRTGEDGGLVREFWGDLVSPSQQ